jgi:S1-C subfamily serine protease
MKPPIHFLALIATFALMGCSAMHHYPSKLVDPMAAVVRIDSKKDGQPSVEGRGFLVSPDGIIATCAKLVADGQTLRITLSDGRTLPGTFLEQDKQSGVALVQVHGTELPTLALFDGDLLPDMHVRALGSAGVTHGRFDHWENFGRDIDFTASVAPKDCGAPLLADDGRAVGVVLGPVEGQPGEFDAAPIWQVLRLMPQLVHHSNPYGR